MMHSLQNLGLIPKLMINITTRLMANTKVFVTVVYLFLFIFPFFATETKRLSFIYETFIEWIECNINHMNLGNNLYENLVLMKKILFKKNNCFKRPDTQLPTHNEFLEDLNSTSQINYTTHLVQYQLLHRNTIFERASKKQVVIKT